ncbi:MAG: subtype III-B CRISPR-assocaited RAMP protein Csx10 [Phormidesmis priestleyi Ana]|uniref:Subtype III-B CRISPR-assocaited RAMP protein Csx10 n=1 Tax=Phormidesmis priestleyi Ana TaxID=1666911 RepID=A0A0P7YRU0_9CYAN|nr:MAG: subtype III-B CRISPR-assocaited RAMP protein Csx10 [Phormidesmis priestleyi Ana]
MKKIDLTITALSPLAIGQRKPGGSVSEALSYIPGSVIRGAIAKEILNYAEEEPSGDDDFYKLFLAERAAVFCNAYPAIAQPSPGQYFASESDIRVLPMSALSSKAKPGFKPEKAGVFDSLIDSFCAREQGHFYVPNNIADGELVEPCRGFYSQSQQRYYTHAVSKRLLTRVGINRRRATAQDEILYSIEVINESQGKPERVPTVFKGSILVQDSDGLAGQLYAFLSQQCRQIRIGGSASRGLGKICLEAAKPSEDKTNQRVNSIEQRINKFNEQLKDRWGWWSVLGDADENPTDRRSFFSLGLQSDAILTENWRRTTVVSPEILAPRIGIEAADITLHMAYTSHDYRSGWNAAWGLPKDTELITNMGSVMLFSIPKGVQSKCYKSLAELEAVGIGSRCSEGYGQVKVCDEFHQVVRECSV